MHAELAYAIIEPHFDAARDVFAEFSPAEGVVLDKVRRTKLIVESSARDSDRHYAACRDDGLLIVMAPDAAQLDTESLVAIICHELGHAVDFLYPAQWAGFRGKPAAWILEGSKKPQKIREIWASRSDDQVEWHADSIAEAVTGLQIKYCGSCQIQCFGNGVERPPGLR